MTRYYLVYKHYTGGINYWTRTFYYAGQCKRPSNNLIAWPTFAKYCTHGDCARAFDIKLADVYAHKSPAISLTEPAEFMTREEIQQIAVKAKMTGRGLPPDFSLPPECENNE